MSSYEEFLAEQDAIEDERLADPLDEDADAPTEETETDDC